MALLIISVYFVSSPCLMFDSYTPVCSRTMELTCVVFNKGNRSICVNLGDVPASAMFTRLELLKPSQDWEDKHQHRYQRVVFSRPDFHWTAPHLPSSFLSLEHIWIMDGQDMKMKCMSLKNWCKLVCCSEDGCKWMDLG